MGTCCIVQPCNPEALAWLKKEVDEKAEYLRIPMSRVDGVVEWMVSFDLRIANTMAGLH